MEFNLDEQLKFKPEIVNPKPLNFDNVIVGAMGGSALPARAMFYLDPVYPLWLHNDYGLPKKSEGKPLYVAISYSGNTREAISFAKEAYEETLPLAIITSGGALKDFANINNLSYVLVPAGLDPRDELVFILKALFVILGKEFGEVSVDVERFVADGARLSEEFRGRIPLIYTSVENAALGYVWKTFINESAKIHAFTNVFPELAHNEIEAVNELGSEFKILMIESEEDSLNIREKMSKFKQFLASRNKEVTSLSISGGKIENLLKVWATARSFAHSLARHYEVDPNDEPSITAFKKL